MSESLTNKARLSPQLGPYFDGQWAAWMAHEFQNSPFVTSASGVKPFDAITNDSGGEPVLDYLGESSLGDLYWNSALPSMGLICGAAANENSIIVRRLLSSHLNDQTSEVLIIHTDHFSLRNTRCPLLHPEWHQVRILVSPDADEDLISIYNASDGVASPITFKDNSITLRHVLALFTPPPTMQGSSAILGTVQLIVSQLRPPFDLQRFIELVDQEKWSEEGANFMALRQTLLTKLLSPAGDDENDESPRRIKLVDLTDPVLQSTGLDNAIMVIAMHDFMRSTSGRKMIVLNNCQEYLFHSSSLNKTLESLAAQGNDRLANILLSTTDPTTIPYSVLHSLDYIIFGSSRSLHWNEFLHKHFTKHAISKTQSRIGRAMIWSPGSSIYALDTSKDDSKTRKTWEELFSFIDVGQFEQSMPSISVANAPSEVTLVNNGNAERTTTEPNIPEDRSTTQDTTPTQVKEENDGEDEEGIISLDKLGMLEPPTVTHAAAPSTFGSSGSANDEVRPSTQSSNKPTQPYKSNPATKTNPTSKFYPLTSAISQLCDGEFGILVGFEAVRKQLGTRDDVKKLGWTTFTQFVKAACDSKVVELIEADPGSKFIALLPTSPKSTGPDAIARMPKDASDIHRDKPEFWASDPALPTVNDGDNLPAGYSNASPVSWSQPNLPSSSLNAYPEQYATLISAIMRLSNNSTGVKVPLGAVRDEIGEKAIVHELITYGWTTLGQWIRCACLEKYAEQGGTGNGAWVMLVGVGHAAMQTDTISDESTRPGDTLMGEEKLSSEQSDCISENKPKPLPEETYQTASRAVSHPEVPGASTPLAFAMNEETSVRGGPSQPVIPSNGISPQESRHVGEPLGPVHKPHLGSSSGDASRPALMKEEPLQESNEQPKAPQQSAFPTAKASEYPSKHLPVVSTILKLTGGVLGAEVRLKSLLALLQAEYPRAREDFLVSLVATAEDDNILMRKRDNLGDEWASLQSPAARPNPPVPPKQESPTQSLPTELALGSPHTSPSEPSTQIPQRILAVGDFPLKHRAVVSIMIKLTNGIPGTKVRTADLTDSLRNEYRGAKEDFLFSLIVKTEEDRILERKADQTGVEWVLLRDPATADDLILLSQKYPTPHNAVALVIQSLVVGNAGMEVSLSLVHRELCHKGYAATMQRAVDMTTAATSAHVMRIQRDDDGERYAFLEDPELSRSLLIPEPTPKGHAAQTEIKEPSPACAGTSNASPTNPSHSNLPANSLNAYPKQYETLISAITQLSGGSTGVKVPLSTVRKEMGEKLLAQEMLTYGWATLEQWVQGACLERYMEKGGTGKSIWVMLNVVKHAALQSSTSSAESTLPGEMQVVEQSLPLKKSSSASKHKPNQMPDETHQATPQAAGHASESHPKDTTLVEASKPSTFSTVNASEYPFKHRPVVSTILKLTGGVLGAKVRMIDFTASLRLDYPRAQEDFLFSLIYNAETDGVLRCEKDPAGVLWVTLQTPASLRNSPMPSTPAPQVPLQPPPTSRSTHPAPPESPMQLEPLNTVDFPLKHRAVVSIIIKLTNGVRGTKVRMADLTGALRSEHRGAKADFLFSLIVKAEDDHVLERETDRAGVVWVSLRAQSGVVSDLTSKDYPIPHRAVVSVIHSLVGGDIGREVPIDLVHGELRRKGYAGTMQGAVDMTTAATAAHVMRVQRDEAGERYAILEDPKLSRSLSEKKAVQSEGKQPSSGHALESYPLIHRPLISTIFTLTNGQCRVRVKMESIIRALMTDPSAKIRDAGVVASLIFEAADADVVQCGKDDLGIWWTSANEPVRPVPQTPKATTQSSIGRNPQTPSSPPAARKPLGSEVLRTSAFSPLIDALKLLKGDTFAEIPYANTVASRVLASMPNVLQQAGCSSMSEYFDLADARGVIWSVGNGDKRMIRLRHG